MKNITVIILSFLFLQLSCLVSYGEEYVLVCNNECPVDTLTSQEVERIFLGKMKGWPSGSSIDIVLNSNEKVHVQFTRKMLHKSPSQLTTYWRKVLFSGRMMLPVLVENDAEAKRYVIEHANAISYIGVTSLDTTLKEIIVVQ